MTTVAVVVPTHRRPALLAAMLDSLAQLTVAPTEIVVVVDGDDAATARVLADRDVTVVHTPGVGPAGARNAGWRATTTDVVAFVDDDCVVEAGWLAALVAGFAADPRVGLVQGCTTPTGPTVATDRTIHVTSETGLYESCNIAYRRAALEAVDGFDEAFARSLRRGGRWFGEDTDLAWRVKRAGWTSTFAADAVVRHHVFARTFGAVLAEEWRRGLFPALVRRIPELRDRTPARWALRPHSGPAQAALLGVAAAAAARSPWPLALAVPYARWALGQSRSPRRLATRAALDLVGSTALAVGSLRARRVLL